MMLDNNMESTPFQESYMTTKDSKYNTKDTKDTTEEYLHDSLAESS